MRGLNMSLPAGGYQPATISYLDAGNEIGTMRFYGASLNAGNFAAKIALWATLLSAADALALGARKKDVYNDESVYTVSQPTNGAMRETRLEIQYQDVTTGEKYSTSLPTLDATLPSYVINVNAKDVVELTAPTEVTDFITAFEAFAVAPRTGNAVSVRGLKVVGRNI